MTVNERLFNAGTIEQFDSAVRRGDRETMIALLLAVEIDPIQAEKLLIRLSPAQPAIDGFEKRPPLFSKDHR
jgi:hypothetical protein